MGSRTSKSGVKIGQKHHNTSICWRGCDANSLRSAVTDVLSCIVVDSSNKHWCCDMLERSHTQVRPPDISVPLLGICFLVLCLLLQHVWYWMPDSLHLDTHTFVLFSGPQSDPGFPGGREHRHQTFPGEWAPADLPHTQAQADWPDWTNGKWWLRLGSYVFH